jgi:YesN/AraC family two-component response regulator
LKNKMTTNSPDQAIQAIKILIIDDDAVIRAALGGLLKSKNYNVTEAKNGNMGISVFRQEKPDVVITDILMPDKEGLETISDIRARDSAVRIIAMSGGGRMRNMSFLKLAIRMGANEVLHKPFRPDDILRLLPQTPAARP